MTSSEHNSSLSARPPVVVVMGHIDHGKSTLLDYIRKSNVVLGEAGGITQHISAYEVEHEHEGKTKKITFLDTPGHEAFSAMRERGATVADIAILVVAADDGVKAQTLEALNAIKHAGVPYIVALNKIDKPNAYAQQAISSLIENEIYIEGYGGDIPCAHVSAKTGEGMEELLDLILITAELEELRANPDTPATGVIIESNVDPRAGISATLLIKDGTLKSGQAICAEEVYAPVRIMRNFLGKSIKEGVPSQPIEIVGFSDVPVVGSRFQTFEKKKEAEQQAQKCALSSKEDSINSIVSEVSERAIVPLVIKADVQGSLEAIRHEIRKLENERVGVKYLFEGVGDVGEADVKMALGDPTTLVIGFNTHIQPNAKDLAERNEIDTATFSIIYELSEWVEKKLRERTPDKQVEEITGKAKILKTFNRQGSKGVVGGKVVGGVLRVKAEFRIMRQSEEIGCGTILGLQQQKVGTNEVSEGQEFGAQIESKEEVHGGDIIECVETKII